jgi:hypothetical protein
MWLESDSEYFADQGEHIFLPKDRSYSSHYHLFQVEAVCYGHIHRVMIYGVPADECGEEVARMLMREYQVVHPGVLGATVLLMTADKDIFQREAAMRSLALPVLDDGQAEALDIWRKLLLEDNSAVTQMEAYRVAGQIPTSFAMALLGWKVTLAARLAGGRHPQGVVRLPGTGFQIRMTTLDSGEGNQDQDDEAHGPGADDPVRSKPPPPENDDNESCSCGRLEENCAHPGLQNILNRIPNTFM